MQMPVPAVVYATFLGVVMVGGSEKSLKEHRPFWYISLGLAHSLILLLLFVGYWSPQLVRPLGPIALALLACSLGWPLLTIPRFLRDINMPELGPQLNRILKALWFTIAVAGDFPGYWFGGIAAWRAL